MAFGFGIGDGIAVWDKGWKIYGCLKNGPSVVKGLEKQLEIYLNSTEGLKSVATRDHAESFKQIDPHAYQLLEERYKTMNAAEATTLDEINNLIKKCGGNGKWDKVQAAWNIEEATDLSSRLTMHSIVMIDFRCTICLHLSINVNDVVNELNIKFDKFKEVALALLWMCRSEAEEHQQRQFTADDKIKPEKRLIPAFVAAITTPSGLLWFGLERTARRSLAHASHWRILPRNFLCWVVLFHFKLPARCISGCLFNGSCRYVAVPRLPSADPLVVWYCCPP